MPSVQDARPALQPGRTSTPRRACNSCKLKLAIGDTSYSVRPAQPGRFATIKAFRLKKGDGTAYDVSELISGPECSCPDFRVNRAERTPCKHIKALAACGLIGGSTHSFPVNARTNGAPLTLVETIDHEALAYKAWRTPTGDFLARQMDRLAQLIRFTGAPDGEDHEARMDVMENDVREEAFERGYAEGKQAARSELGLTPEDRF